MARATANRRTEKKGIFLRPPINTIKNKTATSVMAAKQDENGEEEAAVPLPSKKKNKQTNTG